MAADGRTFDGHTVIFGMDADVDPSVLDSTIAAKAVNRSFRGGKHRTRPPFIHKTFIFANEFDETIVRYGNVQAATAYKKVSPGAADCIVASIAGFLFRFTLVNERFVVERVFDDQNNAYAMHTWFVQAKDWLYIQNGIDKPIFWDGTIPSSARRSNWPDEPEMPIGTIMCSAFGRVFVSNAQDQIAASDIIYGNGFTTTSNTQNFTENTYWQEGGSFGMPTDIGPITGMIVTTAQNQGNLYGQGLVLVLGGGGAQAIEASLPRDTWKDAKIQSVTMTGLGCVAHGSVINVNNKTIFRSDEGLSLYQNLQIDENQSLAFGKFSQACNVWMDEETPSLRQFNSTICVGNRILTTVEPFIQAPSRTEFGNHRLHRGMVCLDVDRSAEKLNGQQLAWDGLWTGVRPTALVNGRFDKLKRGFAFSFDADGENRIYEIAGNGINDEVDGNPVQTEWFYLTKRFDWSSSGSSNTFENKKLVGGELHISEMRDRVSVLADYRSDNRLDWHELMASMDYGPALTGFKFTGPRWKRIKFLTPSDKVLKGEAQPVAVGLQHQVMISGKGSVRIDRVRIAMAPHGNQPNIPVGDDANKIDDSGLQIGLDGKLENDYSYLIVP